ncbi:MAG: LysR family transcriptional regulator [Rhodobacterales bacterium]|nr:MAG: LysR family transcriptional regulator [Rhodobacterales bacterium]
MPRNLDMTALRAFVTVAEVGGVTRAAGLLNLTQSAVSMQLKRLEEAMGRKLLDRSGRSIALTGEGEQLLGYARRILALNDEAWGRLTDAQLEGEIVLGVPHDIVLPHLPPVLSRFAVEFPRMKVNLVSSFTTRLREMFARGDCEIMMATEDGVRPGGRTLYTAPLEWIGAPGGQAWKARPLRLAFENRCIFRADVQAALDRAGIEWEMAVESDMSRTVEASVRADLAVHAMLHGTVPPGLEPIDHGGALPPLGERQVNLYVADTCNGEAEKAFVSMLVQAYTG